MITILLLTAMALMIFSIILQILYILNKRNIVDKEADERTRIRARLLLNTLDEYNKEK